VHAERSQVCEFYLREREEASDIINTSMHSSDKSLSWKMTASEKFRKEIQGLKMVVQK